MAPFHVKRLINATESQIKEIAEFTAEAFYGEKSEIVTIFSGGDWCLLLEYNLAVVRATLLEGLLYVVMIGKGVDEKIVSMGCWFDNGSMLFKTEAQRALGYNTFLEKLDEKTRDWLTNTYPEIRKKIDESHFTKEEIAKRRWCSLLATHPKHQGKGYGTAIVDAIFKKAKADGTFIALDTTTNINVKKYLSMGFEYRGGGNIPAPTGDVFLHLLSKGSLA